MTTHRTITMSLAAFAVAAALVPAALASPGEPKNDSPFTQPVAAQTGAQGESKSDAPFTAPMTSELATPGESKSDAPFTAAAPLATPASSPGDGFDWTAALIGAAVGIGLTLAAFGGATLGRHGQAPQTA